jgi:putative membrane-bound dehydrogenase-like protein
MRLICLSLTFLIIASAHADFPELFNSEPESDKTLMPAEQAAKKFALPDGFKVNVFAAEPDVQNPIAMAWDAKGRLWIAENYTYAERGQRFQLDLRDRVVIFDNTEGERFKQRTVFTDNVQMLTGIEVGHDGVWLMCPPKLMFLPDRDHDDVPDGPGEVVLDGFEVAQANYHNFANGLKFGPDGWLYGRCGGSCPGRIGVPGTPDERRLALEGGIWRYHPIRKSVEVLTTGTTNPWGHDWNGVGEMFYVNTVNGHLWHMIPGAHFMRPFTLDPNGRTYEMIDFHADHWHFDTGQGWTKSREGAANEYGGGHSHIGAMIYQGSNWPTSYRGKLLTLNQHGKRANQELLQRDGSGYVARHGDDMMLAGDPWFRGIDLSSGPDGSVFVIDWSDTGECHEHTGVHRTSGRIYKIEHEQAADVRLVKDYRELPETELAAAIRSQEVWQRRQARLALTMRANSDADLVVATAKLREQFRQPIDDAHAVQTFLTLHLIGAGDEAFLREQLAHPGEYVRAWAIRLLTETWPIDDALGPVWRSQDEAKRIDTEARQLLPELVRLAKSDESALVRLALASTLQRLPVPLRPALAKALVVHAQDANDHNLPLMIWYGLIPTVQFHAEELVEVAEVCRLPVTLKYISRCLAEETEKQPSAINQLVATLTHSRDLAFQKTVLTGISEGLRGWQRAAKPKSWDKVMKIDAPELAPVIRELSVVFGDGRAMDDVKEIALGHTEASPEVRLAALDTLIQAEPEDLREICEQLLKDQRVNVLAARGLAKFDDPEIGKSLVARYRNFRAPFRPQVMSILSSRKSFAAAMLGGIRDGKIPRSDLSAYQVRQIHSMEDDELSKLVREVWGEVRETPEEKQQAISKLKEVLTPDGLAVSDKSAGRALFKKNCQNCHRMYGEGGKVGPDLTGANRSNMDYLLSNIIDPSGVVDKDFRMTVVLMDDGQSFNGLVTSENDRTLALQTATEAMTLDKEAVVRRKITDQSPMPEGMLDNLTAAQIRDLIGYLSHPAQVALPAAQ